jgi:hypothetical protein
MKERDPHETSIGMEIHLPQKPRDIKITIITYDKHHKRASDISYRNIIKHSVEYHLTLSSIT